MARTAGLTLELNNYRAFTDEMRNLDRIIDGLDDRIDRVGRSMDKFERENTEAGRSMQGLGQQSEKTSRQVQSDFQAIGREAERLESTGQRLEGFGARLTLFISGPALALKQFATDAAIEFESSFAGVKKTLDTTGLSAEETTVAFAELREGIRDLATDGTSAVSGIENAQNELARIAELGGQLGVAREDLLNFTETVGELTLATDLSAESASTMIAQFTNITGGKEFDRLGSTIVELGNRMATTEGQVLEFGSRLAAAGTQAGFSQADILGLGAAMASLGLEAEAGGTAMTRVFNTLGVAVATGNADLRTFAEVSGLTVDEFSQLFEEDAAGALNTFIEGLSELDRAAQLDIFNQLGFNDVRVQDTLSRLSANPELLAEGIELANQAFEENTALQTEANQRFETTASQMNLLQNNIRDVAISLGDALLPKINAMIDFFVPLIRGLADTNPEILAFGATLLGVAAAAGPVILYLSQFIMFFEFMGTVSLAPLIVPLTLIGAILVDIVTHAEQVGAAFSGLSAEFGELFSNVASIGAGIVGIIGNLTPTVEAVAPAFSPVALVLETITAGIQAINEQLSNAAELLSLINFATTDDPLAATEAERNRLLEERQQILLDIQQLEQGIADSSGVAASHTVEQGDTLYDLARQYGVTVDQLKELNGLTDSTILVGQELVISEGSSDASAEIATLQAQLDALDAQIAGLPATVQAVFNAFAGTPLFEQIFGSDPGAAQRALQFFEDVNVEIQNIQSFLNEIGGGILDIFAGDIESGAARVQAAFDGIVESVLSVFDLFFGLNADPLEDVAEGVARAEEEFGGIPVVNPLRTFVNNLKTEFDKLASGDFSSIDTWIQENVIQAVTDGIDRVKEWLVGPSSAIRGFVGNLIAPFIDEFEGFRRALEDSPLVKLIEDTFSNVFGSLFGDPFADINLDAGIDISGLTPSAIFGQLGTFKDQILDFIGGLQAELQPALETLGIIFGPAFKSLEDGIVGFIEGVQTIDWPQVQTTFEEFITPILDTLAGMATGGLVVISSILAGIGAALPAVGLAIGDFGTAIGALSIGDIDGFFNSMSSGLTNLANAIGLFVGGAIGNVDQVMSDLTEQDLLAQGATPGELNAAQGGDGQFDGIGTRLNEIKDTVVGFFTGIQTALAPVFTFFDDTIGQGLRDLGEGFTGFVDEINGADWSGVQTILNAFGTAIGLLSGIFAVAALLGIGSIMSGLGEALPDIGAALGDIADFFSAVTTGDVDGMKTSLHNFLGDIGQAFADFALGAANNVLGVLEDLTGLDFASAEEGLGALGGQISALGEAFVEAFDLDILFDRLTLAFDNMVLALQTVAEKIGEVLHLDTSELSVAQAETQSRVEDETFALAAYDELQTQLGSSAIDLSVPLTIDVNGEAITLTLADALSDPRIVEQLGDNASELITDALTLAAQTGDYESVSTALNLAMTNGIDVSTLDLDFSNVLNQMIADGMSEEDIAAFAQELQAAGIDVGAAFSDAIGQALAEGDIDTAQILTDAAVETGGEEAATTIAQNIAEDFGTELATAFTDLTVDPFTDLGLSEEEARAIGDNIIAGLTAGITEGQPELETATQTMSDDVKALIEESWRVNSPSEYMREIGAYLLEGLALGMIENVGLVNVPLQMIVELEQQMKTKMTEVGAEWQLQSAYMVDAIGKVSIQVKNLIPNVMALHAEIAKIGAVPILYVVPGQAGVVPQFAEGGRGEAGMISRVAEPSIGGIELIRTDAGGSYMISSTGFYAMPPEPLNSDFVYGGGGRGGAGGGSNINNTFGDIYINVPAGTAQVTPDVIKEGLDLWSRQNTPQRQHRNSV